MNDLISRQAALDIIHQYYLEKIDMTPIVEGEYGEEYITNIVEPLLEENKELTERINAIPCVQEEEFEWCHDCKEYDQKAHCCHRWTKVIRETIDELTNESEKDWSYDGDHEITLVVPEDIFDETKTIFLTVGDEHDGSLGTCGKLYWR